MSREAIVHVLPNAGKFSLNAGKYGPEKTPYLDTFHAVKTMKL